MGNYIKTTCVAFFMVLLAGSTVSLDAQTIIRQSQSQSIQQSASFGGGFGHRFGGFGWGGGYYSPFFYGGFGYWTGQQYGPYGIYEGMQRLPKRKGYDYFRTPKPTHYIERNRMDHGYIGDDPDAHRDY